MGNHQGGESPIVELCEQGLGGGRGLDAIDGQFTHGHVVRTGRRAGGVAQEPSKIETASSIDGQQTQAHGQALVTRRRSHGAGRLRTDGPSRDRFIVRVEEDHVLVSVVVVRGRANMAPLPAEIGHQVGVRRITCRGIALAHGLHRLFPKVCGEVLRMIIDGPKIEARAVAGEITGIGGRATFRAPSPGEVHHEGVEAEGRVDVKIAEEHLLGGDGSHASGGGRLPGR